ncbi:MAG: P27 family phage terminase small subunit [Rhodospirillales bacterium]|jgi:P27 family predicted phage terminase small subunit|nr:P27 family phage terminase small subunit [Rhodospirillales bacterium]
MQELSFINHDERADKEGLISCMHRLDRSTAPVVKFSQRNVNQAKTLLQDAKIQCAEVVSISGCSATSKSGPCRSGGVTDLNPPPYLVDEIAIREWITAAPALLRRGLLDEIMKPLLAGYCNAIARSVRAEQVLAKEGRYYKTTTRGGSTVKRRHPAVQDAEEGWASVRYFAKQLGISPLPGADERTATRDVSMFK